MRTLAVADRNRWRMIWTIFTMLAIISALLLVTVVPASAAAPNLTPPQTVLGSNIHLGAFDTELAHLDWIATTGMNTLGYGTGTLDDYKVLLQAAQQRGQKAYVSLSPSFLSASDAAVQSFVASLAGYDSVSLWMLPEEPVSSADHAAWARLYALVKAADPKKRPIGVYLAEDTTAAYFRSWSDIADVIFCGAYQELYGLNRAAIVTRVKGAVEGLAGTGKAVISTPQYFDLKTYMQANGLTSAPAGMYVGHPSPQAARFDAYVSLIVGAQGLNWYTLEYGLALTDLTPAIQKISKELKELTPVIMSTEKVPTSITVKQLTGPTQSADAGGRRHDTIQSMIRQYKGATYIFVASLVPDVVSVQFSGLSGAKAEVLYESRSLAIRNKAFKDNFSNYAVHVYKITTTATRAPGDESTEEALASDEQVE